MSHRIRGDIDRGNSRTAASSRLRDSICQLAVAISFVYLFVEARETDMLIVSFALVSVSIKRTCLIRCFCFVFISCRSPRCRAISRNRPTPNNTNSHNNKSHRRHRRRRVGSSSCCRRRANSSHRRRHHRRLASDRCARSRIASPR
jgi:hypothetical protein